MRIVDALRARIRSVLGRRGLETELSRELQYHLDQATEEGVSRGLSEAEARRRAAVRLGGVAQVQEEVRDTWLENLVRDFRLAWRGLVRQPALIAAAATSIGLGVAVNVTIFGLANEFPLARPSARAPKQLVRIRTERGSHAAYAEWRALNQSGALAGIAGYQIEREVVWSQGERSVGLTPLLVTANYFDLLGVPFVRGRGFGTVEASAESDPRIVVVSHGFWRQQLGGDTAVIGRSVSINAQPYQIVGVLAPKIRSFPGFGLTPDLYLPIGPTVMPDYEQPNGAIVEMIGRLRDGQTLPAGRAAVAVVADRMGRQAGDTLYHRLADFIPASGLGELGGVGPIAAFFGMLAVVVALVLAIACANVAGLLLARNSARGRELAIRLSLGASRRRLAQQMVADGLWLAVIGTVAGLAVAVPIIGLVNRLPLPVPVPFEIHLMPDWRLATFALASVIGATLLSAIAPALDAGRVSFGPLVTREVVGGGRKLRGRRALVVTQVAVSLVLLVTAALFLRNLTRTAVIDPGFDVAHTGVAEVTFVPQASARFRRAQTIDGALERLRATPGVTAATVADGIPLTIQGGSTNSQRLHIDGLDHDTDALWENLDVGPGYFGTLAIPIRRGREFLPADGSGSPSVAVVNEEFVRRYLDGREPVGRRISVPGRPGAVPFDIVGVVGNVKHRSLGEPQRAAIYRPYAQRAADRQNTF